MTSKCKGTNYTLIAQPFPARLHTEHELRAITALTGSLASVQGLQSTTRLRLTYFTLACHVSVHMNIFHLWAH